MHNARRKTVSVDVGGVKIGSEYPIRIQSMTNTETADVAATARQIKELVEAGSELVRITVNTKDAAMAVPRIKAALDDEGINVPLIGDFHYNGHILLRDFPECARTLDKYRINPGNVGAGKYRDKNFQDIIQIARVHGKPVRIGVNWGSLDKQLLTRLMDENAKCSSPRSDKEVLLEAVVESALESARLAEESGIAHDKIILSAKISSVDDVVLANRMLASRCDYPLHIGLTEAGMGVKGIVASTCTLTTLLSEGIGDTIRVSLTPAPNEKRSTEIVVCQQVLQSLGIRTFNPSISACPGCGRTSSVFFMEMADEISRYIEDRTPGWRKEYPGVENLHIAVMGCVVNGPGESRHADIGISLPGTGEHPKAPVYIDGSLFTTLSGPSIAQDFIEILENYVKSFSRNKNSPQIRGELSFLFKVIVHHVQDSRGCPGLNGVCGIRAAAHT